MLQKEVFLNQKLCPKTCQLMYLEGGGVLIDLCISQLVRITLKSFSLRISLGVHVC